MANLTYPQTALLIGGVILFAVASASSLEFVIAKYISASRVRRQDAVYQEVRISADARCPYCKDPIDSDDWLVICGECGVVHHSECWQESDACCVFGCKGHSPVAALPS
jgi:Zn finger protein HypA/HybF involved in hydrogenase expression